MVFMSSKLKYCRRHDLENPQIETIWLEIQFREIRYAGMIIGSHGNVMRRHGRREMVACLVHVPFLLTMRVYGKPCKPHLYFT